MRIWLACFFVLFALAQLFDWLQNLTLPLPIYILGGSFLAIASNYNKGLGFFFGNSSTELPLASDSSYSSDRHNLNQESTTITQASQFISIADRQTGTKRRD